MTTSERDRDRINTPVVSRRAGYPRRVAYALVAILVLLLVAAGPQAPGTDQPDSKDTGTLGLVGALVGLVGGAFGIWAFIWKLWDRISGHLRVCVECAKVGTIHTVLTKVENDHKLPKELEFVCLVVGPENEDSIDTVREIAKALNARAGVPFKIDVAAIERYRHIFTLVYDPIRNVTAPTVQVVGTPPIGSFLPFQAGGRALIPLPFYYEDNVDIADETIQYRASLDSTAFTSGKTYSVRLIVIPPERRWRDSLERFTQDLFVA